MEQAQDLELEEIKAKGMQRKLFTALVVVLGIVAIGMVGHLTGAGFFGYRAWMYEGGTLYVLNFKSAGLNVVVDNAESNSVPFENAKMVDILGGTSRIEVKGKDGKVLNHYDVTAKNSHVMLKQGDACVIVLDMSNYYRKSATHKKFKIVKRMGLKDDLFVPNSTNVVWPRNSFPKKYHSSQGPLYWFEKVACTLLDADEEHMLLAYMERRLIDRMNRNKLKGKHKRILRQRL